MTFYLEVLAVHGHDFEYQFYRDFGGFPSHKTFFLEMWMMHFFKRFYENKNQLSK